MKLATNDNEIKTNSRAYSDNNFCAIVMGILTMWSIAVCLLFQRCNLYIIIIKSLVAIKSVSKTFAN